MVVWIVIPNGVVALVVWLVRSIAVSFDSIMWRLSADHGQKRELGDVTIRGTVDITRPITEGRAPINSAAWRTEG